VVSSRDFSNSDATGLSGNLLMDLAAGDYTLIIDGVNDMTGAYGFRLLDLSQSAVSLTPGAPVSATLSPGNETDIYRFNATAGDSYFFDYLSKGSGTVYWRLLDPFGAVVFDSKSFTADQGPLTLSLTGAYTLLVEGYYGNTAGSLNYSFNVEYRGNTPMPPLATGTSLTLGSLVSGSATATTQQSLYSLTLSAETQVYMDALNGAGYSWTLTGPRGVVVNSRKFSSTDANALSGNPVMTLVPGDYLLTVTGSTGAFAFKMLDVGQAATTITPGTLISGSLLPGQETDVYRFDVQAGDTYYFDSRGATNASAYWRLLDPFGNVVFGSTSLGSSSSVNPSDIGIRTLTLAGTYTLLVEGSITNPSASVSYAYNVVPVIPSAAVIITGLGWSPAPI